MNDTIFVTGASGHLGRLVLQHLLARGVTPARLIAGTRSPEKLADLAAAGIAVRKADFEDRQGLTEAFDGVGTVLVISTDALEETGARLKQHRNAVASAAAAGVGRLAYTSQFNPASSLLSFANDHLETERAIQASGLPHVIFRNGWYHENLLMSLPAALKRGQWHSAAQGGRTSYAAREDIAEAIAAVLAGSGTDSRIYTLTGSEALNREEIAERARRATGQPLTVVNVTDEQFAEGLKAAGVPGAFIPVLVSIEAETRAGNLSIVTDHLASLLARPPKRLADHLDAAKASYLA
ncbi:SDR family oxidoreductase [Burkholderia gladioli]|uniref:SDR family oxidoreductase n=1 Tax=Burkholderia gladioli TaxID=28095 RepID=UPI000F8012EC|nr:SDR family oxidoreductase [Burkholderia gladioli]MBJ9678352.1 SDR family oxidoreductase [Burkholderia gladioli]MBU9322587.1 SDR family oxidoreductase [Burkholderia gladioli]MDN7461938.1 SDR family oxidoreductase [Burkholderia gladioli]